MEAELNVTMKMDSACNLYAIDNSDYESMTDVNKHAIVEVVTNKDSENKFQRLHFITGIYDPLLRMSENITLELDGTYTYYRIIVPQLDELLQGTEYKAKDKYFATNSNIYKGSKDFTEFIESEHELITDYLVIWEDKDKNYLFWFSETLFTVCKLDGCISEQIENWINDTCTKKCQSTKDLKLDFLLDSSFAINYFVKMDRFDDAQRVLDTITTCGSPCENSNINNTCGCGNIIH